PAARRCRPARTRAAARLAARVAAVPALRDARHLLPRVLGWVPRRRVRSVPRPPLPVRARMSSPIRRLKHLTTRYFSSLGARSLDDEAALWVAGTLEPGEREVWAGMSTADQAEGVAVARAFRAATGDDDPRWLAAALLHDAGKQVSDYGTLGRVFA